MALAIGAASGTASAERTAFLSNGTAPQHERDLSTRVAADAIQAQLGALAKAGFNSRDTLSITRCLRDALPWTCMRPVLQGKNLNQLVIASADTGMATDGSPTIVVSVQIVVESLDSVIGDTRYCAHCTDDVLAKLTGDLAAEQLRELAVRLGHTVIKVSSVPRGARITFDGKSFGATDASINTFPGNHTVVLTLEHYQVEQRSINAVDGKTVELPATLRPEPAPTVTVDLPGQRAPLPGTESSLSSSHGSLAGPLTLLGVGTAAMIGGSALIFVWNGKPVADPSQQQAPTYRDRTAPGIGLVAVGVVTAGVGGYWWWKVMHSSDTAPMAVPTAGGAIVGLVGKF